MSQYSAKINGIQAIVCDYDLITNEKGEYIVFDPDIELDYFSLNFIVTTEDPICKIESFDNISVTVDKVGNYLYNDGEYTVSEYKAVITKHKYSADITAHAV
jgi:hypothetical protein